MIEWGSWNTIPDLIRYFFNGSVGVPSKDEDVLEFLEFWKSIDEDEKHYYRQASLDC